MSCTRRNRLRACRAAGVEPRFETWDGRGAVAELIVSLNLKRRHLNESQRAMLAAKLRERQGLFDSRTNWSSGNSADQTAALLNVSHYGTIGTARRGVFQELGLAA